MKRLILAILLLILAITAQAQEEEEDDIPYVDLGSNFAVPALPDWEHVVQGETVLFSNHELNAQIYVAAYDTQDVESAITQGIGHVYTGELSAPIVSSRIAPNNGTWEYRLFSAGDTSISTYGMLKSNRSYVVVFIENSPDYSAYHLAFRSSIGDAEGAAIRQVLDESSLMAVQQVINPDFAGEIQNASNPNPDNESWVLAEYEDNIATASYLNDNIVFVTLVMGEAGLATHLSNDFDTAFLGFVITPNNSEYLYLGLTFAGSIMLILIGSMWLRYRNLQKDLKVIEQLKD